jgi:hypothetical protein
MTATQHTGKQILAGRSAYIAELLVQQALQNQRPATAGYIVVNVFFKMMDFESI